MGIYILSQDYKRLIGHPIYNKFEAVFALEECAFNAVKTFNHDLMKPKQPLKIFPEAQIESFLTELLSQGFLDDRLKKQKDDLPTDSVAYRALDLDFNRYMDDDVHENDVQLFPSEYLQKSLYASERNALAAHVIDKQEIMDREYFHLRGSRQNQIKLTLDYYLINLDKLDLPACQRYLEANLFQPGLLIEELKRGDGILKQVETFIRVGLKHFSKPGLRLSEETLFFLRLSFLIYRYAAEYQPEGYVWKLERFQEQLTAYLQMAERDQPEIVRDLHQLRYQTAIARFKLKPDDAELLLSTVLPSFFYMHARGHFKQDNDLATEFELASRRLEVKKLIALSPPERLPDVLQEVVTGLGLGIIVNLDKKTDDFYEVLVNRDGQCSMVQFDIENGLIFNEQGMAYTPIPLMILHHPTMQVLKIDSLEPCTRSIDNLVYELGDPVVLRFIRATQNGSFRVQKKWTVGGVSAWYELHALSPQQQQQLDITTSPITVGLPHTHQQRESHVWVRCERPQLILITENNQPVFISDEFSSRTCQFKQLNSEAMETGFKMLNPGKIDWLYALFDQFEDRRFITIWQKQEFLEINLDRYGFTLIAERQGERWIFYRKDGPSQRLIIDEKEIIEGVSWLVFEDETTKQRHGYVPRQPFIETHGPSQHSEFYHFVQDIKATIPEQLVLESSKEDLNQLRPWQYTGTEQLMCFPLDEHDKPFANTPEQALYLCYLYLGCHQPEQAWAILEDCSKRLGGLKGTIDELKMLCWIIDGLPRKINPLTISEATISTPAYVACKLKALALLTSAVKPDHVLTIPNKTFDLQTPEGHYQQRCWKQLQAFLDRLNQTIYSLYSTRFQPMQRHNTHRFLLSDDEKKSLLDFYHDHLPGNEYKAIGSLGYEWQRLQLIRLQKEREALQAQKRQHTHFPNAYEKRLLEIDAFINQETIVRAYHTELMLRPIDLSIPQAVHFFLDRITYDSDVTRSWLSMRDGDFDRDEAIHQLKPGLTELEMVRYFPFFCKLAVSKETSANKSALIDFCRRYLMTHAMVPLDKQQDQLGYLINLLYRMSQFPAEMTTRPLHSCYEFINRARMLPEPIIELYQPVDLQAYALTSHQEIWKSILDEMPRYSEPMMAQSVCPLDDFTTIKLLAQCELNSAQKNKLFHLFHAYQQKAGSFVAQREKERAVVKERVLTPSELDAGKIQTDALRGMKEIAYRIFSDRDIATALLNIAKKSIEQLEIMRQQQRLTLLTCANSGPADDAQYRRRVLEIEGEVRAPFDEAQLLALYLKADKGHYQSATGLSDRDIDELHTQISHYIAISVRQQSLQRFCAHHLAVTDAVDMTTSQQLAETLFTENHVHEQTEPVLNLFQFYENVNLRPQQIAVIKRLIDHPEGTLIYHELIEKIIMGGGKSKVILPLLASLKATGSNLMVIEVPQPLFETNSTDLDQTSRRLFNQKVCRFEFNRESDCSSKSLLRRYQQLIDVISNRDYLVTTGEAVQSLELKYFELLLSRPSDETNQAEWKQQIIGLDKLVGLFRTRADAVIDEVHQGLLLKKKLNYTLGRKRSIPSHLVNQCVDLYSGLKFKRSSKRVINSHR